MPHRCTSRNESYRLWKRRSREEEIFIKQSSLKIRKRGRLGVFGYCSTIHYELGRRKDFRRNPSS
jgi:hypothetical protein